jgi:hypothetical protein
LIVLLILSLMNLPYTNFQHSSSQISCTYSVA